MSNLRLCEAFQLRGVSAVFKSCNLSKRDKTLEEWGGRQCGQE